METTIGRGRPPGLALVEGRETTVHPLDVGKNAAVQLPGFRKVFEDRSSDVNVDAELARQGDGGLADRGF